MEDAGYPLGKNLLDRFHKFLLVLGIITLLLLSLACQLLDQTPVVVTATPEPTDTPVPGPTVPTWTPGPTYTPAPTWTPMPSPTPTITPGPTPTPTLRDLAVTNAPQCLPPENRTASILRDKDRYGVIADEGGTALVKAKLPEQGWRYWRYEPGPVRGTFACKPVNYEAYPIPTPVALTGEGRTMQVAAMADEVCRTWVREWNGRGTFTNIEYDSYYDRKFRLVEVRPANEEWALARVSGEWAYADDFVQQWSSLGDIYLVYSLDSHTCVETEYSARAWQIWPEIPPTLEDY